MKLLGDYHTHTKYSHGTGTVRQNAEVAVSVGLKEIAITDHGFSHVMYSLKKKAVPKMRDEIAQCSTGGLKILLGIESNINGYGGEIDVKEYDYDLFDIIIAGYHFTVWANSFKEQFSLISRNIVSKVFGYSKSLQQATTKMYINAIKKNKIDLLTHINYAVRADCSEVAKAARDYGTYIEINDKHMLDDDNLAKMASTGVNFLVSSDAHSPHKVASTQNALDAVKRLNIDIKQIHNIDRLPSFRSKT